MVYEISNGDHWAVIYSYLVTVQTPRSQLSPTALPTRWKEHCLATRLSRLVAKILPINKQRYGPEARTQLMTELTLIGFPWNSFTSSLRYLKAWQKKIKVCYSCTESKLSISLLFLGLLLNLQPQLILSGLRRLITLLSHKHWCVQKLTTNIYSILPSITLSRIWIDKQYIPVVHPCRTEMLCTNCYCVQTPHLMLLGSFQCWIEPPLPEYETWRTH